MDPIVSKIRLAADRMNVGLEGIMPDPIRVARGAIGEVESFISEKGLARIALVADANTYRVAGERVEKDLAAAGFEVALVEITPNHLGDVVADEASIVQVLLAVQRNSSDVVIAVGSGTLHDISRYAAYTSQIPFISVPTAPSVDGFTSKGAPLIIRGDKITVPAVGPLAIFADLDILCAAPQPMVAAGFADMLGKYTSLLDWKFGSMTAGEPYAPEVAEITEQALMACVRHAEEIGNRTEEGIRILTDALIESGLAMLLFGQSHPASGGEHHLSHFWEMTFIREGRRQLLHGAKVGVACAEVAALYHRIAEQDLLVSNVPEPILRQIAELPTDADLRALLRTVGGPDTIADLGIGVELLDAGLKLAHHIRPNRFTLLRACNETMR
ncbi:sn-glycerol-1-phosphate dehydrogenase [Gorillibacterium massiliense]|uniref:sn-glycerol-1-phosphate dehydrogenase n=1 Tax=Gorillibacterium massiliense TaxID=1280390 RepID=UPI0004B0ADCD|nr:sn-glycerol-1-phosphate dehydrogenase [Gorillibacterium massiliense]